MGSFRMEVGEAEIVALSDMNCVFPMPLAELWPNVPVESWQTFRPAILRHLRGPAHAT